MPSVDSPDWSNNIQVQYGGAVTDAPDWVRVVSGPGGGAITGVTAGVSNQPQDLGQIGWCQDYRLMNPSALTLVGGRVYVSMVQAVVSAPITGINLWKVAAGSSLSTTNCNIAVYDQTFSSSTALAIGTPSDIAATWQGGASPGFPIIQEFFMTTTFTTVVGTYYMICVLVNGGTSPHVGTVPYTTEFVGVGHYLFSAATTSTSITSLTTNAFTSTLETATPQVWMTLGPG